MGDVVIDISMSLDGFVTGPDPGPEAGLGTGGEALHLWAIEGRTDADQAILDATVAETGCVVMGRTLFDIIDGPHGWSDDMGYGGERDQSNTPPVVVVTHRAPDAWRLGERFRFATGGIVAAIAEARELADGKHVNVMGGAAVIRSVLLAGLADELRIHLAPVLLGAGTRLFDHLPAVATHLAQTAVVRTPQATHLTYRFDR